MLRQLPRNIFNRIKQELLRQQRQIEKNLKKIEATDPVKSDGLAQTSEPGTDSWMAEVHSKTQAVKANLSQLLQNTIQALSNLRNGNYGKCQKCGRQIELPRLLAMPTATLCLTCSKKASS